MSEPRFLTVAQVERLYRVLIERFGGTDGLRDPRLFEGAVIHPRNFFGSSQSSVEWRPTRTGAVDTRTKPLSVLSLPQASHPETQTAAQDCCFLEVTLGYLHW